MGTERSRGPKPANGLTAWLGLVAVLVLVNVVGVLTIDLAWRLDAPAPPEAAPDAPTATGRAAREPHVEAPGMAVLRTIGLSVASIVAQAVIAPMVGAFCLFRLLRRYGDLELVIRGEYPGPSGSGVAPGTARPLNLGPSLDAEEGLARREQAGRCADAMLTQVVEENVKLRERIALARMIA